jgi:uncharacterized membrane protein
MTDTQTVEAPEAQRTKRAARMPFLDWTRGLAATIMLQGHVFHSFVRPELRESGLYVISQFVGGIAPAIFLFLTGVTLAFMMSSMERKLASRTEKLMTALRRAAYLGVLAFAFRIQLFLFGWPHSPAQDLLKVDILNCMALAIVTMAGLAVLSSRVANSAAGPCRCDCGSYHCVRVAAHRDDSTGCLAECGPHVSGSGWQLLRVLPLGGFPCVRHQRRVNSEAG